MKVNNEYPLKNIEGSSAIDFEVDRFYVYESAHLSSRSPVIIQ
jgi:hypothetical protein